MNNLDRLCDAQREFQAERGLIWTLDEFNAWLVTHYGIQYTNYAKTDYVKVLDEAKYLWFLLKFS